MVVLGGGAASDVSLAVDLALLALSVTSMFTMLATLVMACGSLREDCSGCIATTFSIRLKAADAIGKSASSSTACSVLCTARSAEGAVAEVPDPPGPAIVQDQRIRELKTFVESECMLVEGGRSL